MVDGIPLFHGLLFLYIYALMCSIEDDNSHSVEKVKITLGKILCYTQISWNDMINNQSYNFLIV